LEFGSDLSWVALGVTTDKPTAEVNPDQGAFVFLGIRRLGPGADVVFGARWNIIRGHISFTGPLGIQVSQTKQWGDPVVGLNLRTVGGNRAWFPVRTIIGGFGAGSTCC
jgi:hypothetical protein